MFMFMFVFLVADTQLYKRLCPSVRRSVGPSVVIELENVKTRISAPAHPSATDICRVSGLVVFLTPELLDPKRNAQFLFANAG